MLISLPKSSFRALLFAVGIVLAALTAAAEVSASETIAWRLLQPGLEYATVVLPPVPGSSDTQLHVVRVNPRIAHLRGLMASEHGNTPRTAGQWCTEFGLSAAINLGMFKMDGITNVGYARNGAHRNNPGWNSYQAVLALLPS